MVAGQYPYGGGIGFSDQSVLGHKQASQRQQLMMVRNVSPNALQFLTRLMQLPGQLLELRMMRRVGIEFLCRNTT
ncbi:hypothetical protein JCM31598_03800 [Desulfonatronum parangueonense]